MGTQPMMKENILLVEDEQALQMVVGDRLHKEGYQVDCASDAETGFSKATSKPFDLMIFDIMLPRRSGLDLCRDVRGAGLATPILLLSAYQQTVIKTTGFELGADDYMTKPFDMTELSARVEALLRRTTVSRSSPQRDASPRNGARQPDPKEELSDRLVAWGKSSQLIEIVPRLRTMINEQRESPQTASNTSLLHVAESVIEFLEEILEDARSWRRAGPREI
jgi:DNA-binding response OmpR family regulator